MSSGPVCSDGAESSPSMGPLTQHVTLEDTMWVAADPDEAEAAAGTPPPEADEEIGFGDLKKASLFQLAFVGFFIVSGGPLGVEPIINAGGAGPALLAFVLFPLVFAFPQSLLVAELASMFPFNGGAILWSFEAFGELACFVTSYTVAFCNTIDLGLYPVLAATYLGGIVELSGPERWVVMTVLVVLCFYFNVRGVDVVGNASGVFCALVFLPYFVEGVVVLCRGEMRPRVWMRASDSLDITTFVTYLYWNFSGFPSIANMAGEVRNPKRTFPLAVALTIVLISVAYAVPVITSASLQPDFAKWENGSFVTIAGVVGGWMRVWVSLSGVAAAFGLFNANLGAYARSLWRASHFNMLPNQLSYTTRGGTVPMGALIYHSTTALALGAVPFSKLIDITVFFAALGLMMVLASFGWFRYRHPEVERPFRVPGGPLGAAAAAGLPASVVFYVFSVSHLFTVAVSMGAVFVVVAVFYPIWVRYGSEFKPALEGALLFAEDETEGEDADSVDGKGGACAVTGSAAGLFGALSDAPYSKLESGHDPEGDSSI